MLVNERRCRRIHLPLEASEPTTTDTTRTDKTFIDRMFVGTGCSRLCVHDDDMLDIEYS